MKALLDAVLVDIGGTLVEQASPVVPVTLLDAQVREDALGDLKWLSQTVKIGAVTDTAIMDEAQVRQLLEPSGVSALLDVVITSFEVGVDRPDPTSLLLALERLGLDQPGRVLFIGDQPEDESAAAAAGMLYTSILGPNGENDLTIRQVVQAWLERTAGHRFEDARARIEKGDIEAANAALARQDALAKPTGSLGRVESLGVQLAGIAGVCPPPVPEPAAVAVFASDHGIVEWCVSPWPREATAQMVGNLAAGGAAVNVLARHAQAEVIVVDVGVATTIPVDDHASLISRPIRPGTSNLATGPAMSRTEALLALDVGVEIADIAIARGARCLLTGEVGIGNTTSATAIIAGVTNQLPGDITGRGSGADDEMLARKITVIESAITTLSSTSGPLTLLEQIGGFEIAAIAGLIVGGAAHRVPIIIDGVVADAALLIATQLAPNAIDFVIAGHRSAEPAASAALDYLGIDPVLDLDLELGEGTGAVLALPIVQAAAKLLAEMATFDRADADAGTGDGTP